MMPKTVLGKWSVAAALCFLGMFGLSLILVASGQRGGDRFSSNLALSVPILLAGVCGVGALVAGAVSIMRSRERSPLVFLAVAIGLMVAAFGIGEVASPH
ncbi:MAG: hypothetical protein HYX90_11435 [Chloroflexi bacterium]|nr:hypothetical protein [Chloroflexota bacterium]